MREGSAPEQVMFFTGPRRDRWTTSLWRLETAEFSQSRARYAEMKVRNNSLNTPQSRGRSAVWQAKLAILVMINLAQMWILSAVVEAALAHEMSQLVPLVVASGFCWLIALTIFLWWTPAKAPR
jgi:hypothetical protein